MGVTKRRKRSFNSYVDKKRGMDGHRKDHVTQGGQCLKCRGDEGQNWVEFGPRIC